MATVKLWGRIQPRQATQKFFRCGMEFSCEWPQEPVEVDKATAERLEQEQMLEVTYTDPHATLKTTPEADRRSESASQASDAPVTDAADALNNHDEINADADLPQGAEVGDGGGVTGNEGDKSAESKGGAAPIYESERLAVIKTATFKLDPANADLWTVQGLPKTEPLSVITGWAVSAADRDAAWALVLADKGEQ